MALGVPWPRLDSRPLDLTSLSFLNRLVRTRMLGGVGAGEGDLPGYPISPPTSLRLRGNSWLTRETGSVCTGLAPYRRRSPSVLASGTVPRPRSAKRAPRSARSPAKQRRTTPATGACRLAGGQRPHTSGVAPCRRLRYRLPFVVFLPDASPPAPRRRS